MSQWHGGKGSTQRPKSIADEEYAQRWDAIFGKKDKPSAVDDCATTKAESAVNEKQNSIPKKSS